MENNITAVPDGASHTGVEDARGDQPEGEVLVGELDRVAGVVAALVARHDVELLAQQVDDFPFAFVAPLSAENGYVRHCGAEGSTTGCRLSVVGCRARTTDN